ncbi:hypothetical protein NL529_28920, partial [Klebsiella pneumoniae]|nr:hypothetical protein [Klebsiella pneumoniae]
NPATGSLAQDGAEYYLAAERSVQGSGWWVERWDGSKYVDAAQTPSMLFVRSGDTMMWGVDKSDIGVTDGFTFYVWSSTWDANDNLVAEDT